MIPKNIHYCWFGGGDHPELEKKCIESWRKIFPDYALKEWNEENFDINCNQYVKEAYETKKYAFVSDYVRLYALYNEGGIYFDTDLEVLKPMDQFLVHPAFLGFEDDDFVGSCVIGSEPHNLWVKNLLSYYTKKEFIMDSGELDITTNTTTITKYMLEMGLVQNNEYQEFYNLVVIYPSEFFSPKSHGTGVLNLTDNSFSIHHFAMSWQNKKSMIFRVSAIKKKLIVIFGEKIILNIVSFFKLREIKELLLNKRE